MSETALVLSRKAAEVLAERGIEQSRLDAELILAHVLGISRLQLYLQHDRPLTDEELVRFRALIRRRLKREPVQYLTGAAHFRHLELAVDPRVLIPRPETEELVGHVLDWAWAKVGGRPSRRAQAQAEAGPLAQGDDSGTAGQRDGGENCAEPFPHAAAGAADGEVAHANRLAVPPSGVGQGGGEVPPTTARRLTALDLCTGSGAIALALAKELPQAVVLATDVSAEVILEVKDKERAHPEDLDNLYVRSNTGGNFSASGAGGGTIATTTGNMSNLVPLRVVTSTKEVIGPQAVNHLNQFTSVTFNFNLLPDVAIGDATKFIEDAFAQIHPHYPTVQGIFQGETLVFQQLFRSLPILLLAAVFVMYVILGILYESYVHPFTVLFPAIVPAVVGGLATLYLFHSVLSLYSVIGLFLLLGIVKKNGIMVVDFALQRIDEGWDLRSAIHEASVERFRPIMMTTLAALMGAVPIALGFGQDAASRRPLGLVIVGGLIFSQLITLFVTPVIYLWLEWFQEHVLDKVPFLRSAHYHEHEGEVTSQVRPAPAAVH